MDGLGERQMLEAWLEFHRTTLVLKTEGVSDVERKLRPVPTSALSLHGLVRHMAEVERGWFQMVLDGNQAAGYRWAEDDVDDRELVPLDDANFTDDLAAWQDDCETSRRIAAAHELDDTGVHRSGRPCSLRWIYVHMIEEYARHNGHADLIRELVDGQVGW